jgi:hypothetical protein
LIFRLISNIHHIGETNKTKHMKQIKQLILSVFLVLLGTSAMAQVTTSSISGTVSDASGEVLVGANVVALHVPSGTTYGSITNRNGVYVFPAVRVGGPYTIKASFIGFKRTEISDIYTSLGVTANVNVSLVELTRELGEVLVVGNANNTFSKERTGATHQIGNRELSTIPTVGSRTISSVTKYNPFGDGRSFGGQDSRLNNFTIDGSQFNNGFGLGSSSEAGGRTGSTAISLDAIEQLQINVAPFDIRQSGFVGAGINAVTRSGTNEVDASAYVSKRDNSSKFVGNRAYGVPVTAAKFDEEVIGFRLGAPIIKNKLFVFGNYESVVRTEPGTNWISTGSPLTGNQVSRPTFQQLQTLSNFMKEKFDYETGPWEGYSNANESTKGLVRIDWNVNDKHKLTARYIHHDSSAEINISNSSSAGAGNRTQNQNAMSFQNSGYVIMDNTRSGVVEINSKFENNLFNNFIIGYDKQIEDRAYRSKMFPTIDIRENNSTFTSVGFDPFTPANQLNYSTFHITNNMTKFVNSHTLTGGVNYEYYVSNNLFYPASNGVYIFNSLQDFYTAANQSVANGGRPSTLAPARFQLRYSALDGGKSPLQTLRASRVDFYGQDEWAVTPNLNLTFGLRGAVIGFNDTEALENKVVTNMTFANGEKFNTSKMPDTQLLWEPRVAFNYDVKGLKQTQLRGGSGVFTGRPPYVFLSNAVGNNGVLTGFIDVSGTAANNYGFTANPNDYFIPSTPTLPSTFDLAFIDPNFKYPQMWKTNVAIDQKLPFGLIGTVEYLYNRGINSVHYYNANLDSPTTTLNGPDQRLRFAGNDNGVRVNDNVSMASVLTNKNGAYYQSMTVKLEKPYQNGFWGTAAYTWSEAKDYMSAGSIASGSWQGIRSISGNNDVRLSNSNNNTPRRAIGVLGYRLDYGKKAGGATTFTIGYVGAESNPFTYNIGGDLNGDRVFNNELLYVPFRGTDIKFVQNGTFTPAQQQTAFEAFVNQDPYLSTRKGGYTERNALVVPMLHRFDVSVAQDFFVNVLGKRNSFQARVDILNAGNLINDKWGVSQRATAPTLLTFASYDSNGVPQFRMATQRDETGQTILAKDTFSKNSSVFDVWQAQATLRYTFGR